MEPITIILVISAAVTGFAAWKGLKGNGSTAETPSQAEAQTAAGGNALVQIGEQASAVQAQNADAAHAASSSFAKSTIMAAGGAATTGAGVAMASAGGAAAGATVAAVTFGIGAAIGVAIMLWAKHEARIKGAKTENAGWNAIATAFKYTITGIFDQYNQGKITVAQTVAELKSLRQLIMTDAEKFNHMPGVNWSGGGEKGSSTQVLWSVTCDKHCTIGCCLYNGVIGPSINRAIAMIQGLPVWHVSGMSVSTKITVPAIGTTKYGFTGIDAFTLSKLR